MELIFPTLLLLLGVLAYVFWPVVVGGALLWGVSLIPEDEPREIAVDLDIDFTDTAPDDHD